MIGSFFFVGTSYASPLVYQAREFEKPPESGGDAAPDDNGCEWNGFETTPINRLSGKLTTRVLCHEPWHFTASNHTGYTMFSNIPPETRPFLLAILVGFGIMRSGGTQRWGRAMAITGLGEWRLFCRLGQ
jgi:hypothetical protein